MIGGRLPQAPHGAVCGALLPAILQTNCQALPPEAPVHARFDQVEQWIADVFGPEGSAALAKWSQSQGLPGLGEMGLSPDMIPDIAAAAAASSSMKANPVALDSAELVRALQSAM